MNDSLIIDESLVDRDRDDMSSQVFFGKWDRLMIHGSPSGLLKCGNGK
jgi:hypothetical protein